MPQHADSIYLTFLWWLQLKSHTVSSESSSCGRQAQSVRVEAECPAAPLGSPSSPPHWGKGHPPVHRPGNGRRGTCPGSSAPGPLHQSSTTQNTGLKIENPSLTSTCVATETSHRISPWLRTPSSNSTCHMPTAWIREWTHELCCICQSTNSVPTQHCLGKTQARIWFYTKLSRYVMCSLSNLDLLLVVCVNLFCLIFLNSYQGATIKELLCSCPESG